MGDPRSEKQVTAIGRIEVDLLELRPPLTLTSQVIATGGAYRITLRKSDCLFFDILAGDEVCYSIHSVKRERDDRPKEENGKEVPALSGTSSPRHLGKVRASTKPEEESGT